jgi:hypothetical protein
MGQDQFWANAQRNYGVRRPDGRVFPALRCGECAKPALLLTDDSQKGPFFGQIAKGMRI